MNWHILTVAPQSEFRVRDELHALGLSALVPVQFRMGRRKRDGTSNPLRSPVAPGYVFAAVTAWHDLRNIRGWHGAIYSDGRPYRLTSGQVAAIEALSIPIQASPSGPRYKVGDRIRIKRGANADLAAIVADIRRGKVVASVELFGKAHKVEMPESEVEAA